MSNEQNWVEATSGKLVGKKASGLKLFSAAEMAAISIFMSNLHRDSFPKQVTSHAINSYMNCNKPKLAVKCALITLEAVRASGGYIDAAKDYLKVGIKSDFFSFKFMT